MTTTYYSISVSAGTGGTVSKSAAEVVSGGSATISASASSGYRFLRWNDGNTSSSRTISNITSDQAFSATFVKTYTVKYYQGSTCKKTKTLDEGSGYSIEAVSWSNGSKSFVTWNTTKTGTGTNYAVGTSITVNSNIVLYAQWVDSCHTVSYALGGGSAGANQPATAVLGTAFYVSAPTRTGYIFKGWKVTSGLVTSTAKWGTTSSPATAVSSTTVCVNGETGNVYFKNLGAKDTTVTLTAQWQARTYAVTLDQQSGTGGTTSVTATYGSAMPSATMPTRSYYVFGGYYTSTNGAGTQYYNASGASARSWAGTAAATLYAKWTIYSYKVSFNANGGSGSMAQESFNYNESKALTTNAFTRTGYNFTGWNTKADGTGTTYTNGQTVKNLLTSNGGTFTLYARWTAKNCTTTFDSDGGTATSPASVNTIYAAAMPAITTKPTKTGYTFGGFYSAKNGGGTQYYTAAGASARSCDYYANTTLYAKWTANTYSVAFNGNGNTGGTMATQTGFTYGTAKALTANAFTKTGHTFAGWATSATGAVAYANGASVTKGTATNGGTLTLYAKWSPISYDVTLNKNGGTCTDLTKYTYGVGATLPTATKGGYTFNGWYTASSGGTKVTAISTTDTGTKTFYARFTANTYTVTIAPNGGTGGSCPSYTVSTSSQTKTITPPTRTGYTLAGYTFSGATGGTPSNSGTTLTIPANVYGNLTLTAKWTANSYKLRHNKNDGTATNVDKAMTYDTESRIMWQGSELGWTRTGYTFKGWATSADGAVVYENGATVKNLTATANAVYNIYVVWQINQYKVTLTAADGHGTVTGAGTYDYGTQVTIKATPAAGYNFSQWSDGNTSASRTITLGAANVSLTAQFSAHPVNVSAISAPTAGGVSSVNGTPGGGNFETGSTVTLKAAPNTGYNFSKWSDGKAQEHTVVVNGDASKNVYTATYTLKQFDIKLSRSIQDGDTFPSDQSENDCGTVKIDNGTAGNTAQLLAVNYGTEHTITATAKTGWQFVQWTDGNTTASRTITISGNVTLAAVFKRRLYAVTVNVAAGTRGTVRSSTSAEWAATSTTNVKYEASTVIDANPASGWQFKQWGDGNNKKPRTIKIPTLNPAAVTIEAEFERRKFKLTVKVASIDADKIEGKDNDHPGKVAMNEGEYDYTVEDYFYFEDNVLLHSQDLHGWEFDHWSAGTGSFQIPAQDSTVICYFRRKLFLLTVNAVVKSGDAFNYDTSKSYYNHASDNTPGSVKIDGGTAGSTVTKMVKYETDALIEIDETQGWKVWSWDGDTTVTNDARQIEITDTKTVNIACARRTYTVSVAVGAPAGTVRIDTAPSKVLRYGEQDTIHAVAAVDYAFNGWVDDSDREKYDRIITCTGTQTFTANFRYIVHKVTFKKSPSNDYGDIGIILDDVEASLQKNPVNAINIREGQKIRIRTTPGRIYDTDAFVGYGGTDPRTSAIIFTEANGTNSFSFYLEEAHPEAFCVVTNFKEKPKYTLRVQASNAALGSVTLTADYGKANFESWNSIDEGFVQIEAYKGITYNATVKYDGKTVDHDDWTEDGSSLTDTNESITIVVPADSASTEKTFEAVLSSKRRQITFANGTSPVTSGDVRCWYEGGSEIKTPCDVIYGQYLKIEAIPEDEYEFDYFRAINTNAVIGDQTVVTDPIHLREFVFQVVKSFGTQFSLTAFFRELQRFYINLNKLNNEYGVISLEYANNPSKNWSEVDNEIDLGSTNPAHVGIIFKAKAEIVPHPSHAGNEMVKFLGWYNRSTGNMLSDRNEYEFTSTTENAHLEYQARFGAIPLHTVTVNVEGLGSYEITTSPDVEAEGSSLAKFLEGREVTITQQALAEEGYELKRWYNKTTGSTSSASEYRISNIDKDYVIQVEFSRIKFNSISWGIHAATAARSAITNLTAENASVQEGSTTEFFWGDSIRLTATLADPVNYPFDGFYVGDVKLNVIPTIVGNTVTGTYRLTSDNQKIEAKCKAKLALSVSHADNANGTATTLDSEGNEVTQWFFPLGDRAPVRATVIQGMCQGWFYTSDEQFDECLELDAEDEILISDTTAITARFVSESDYLYVCLFNEYLNSEEAEEGVELGELSMTRGEPIEAAEFNTAMFGQDTSKYVTGAVEYYKFAGAKKSVLSAVQRTLRGFHHWKRQVITSAGIGGEMEFDDQEKNPANMVVNRHYAFSCFWGEPKPVDVRVGYTTDSSQTLGSLDFSANEQIDDKVIDAGWTSGKVVQGALITVAANVMNGYKFDGWYSEAIYSPSKLVSSEQEYTFRLSDSITLYARFIEDAEAIYAWDASEIRKDFAWKSKLYVASKPFDPTFIRIDAESYELPLKATVGMFSAPDTAPTGLKELEILDQDARRLVTSRPERYVQVTVQNNAEVDAIFVGTSSKGMAV